MNMIPLVRATEPGTAQNANRERKFLSCSLEILIQLVVLRKSFWKKASKRVRIPYLANHYCSCDTFSKSRVVWECSPKWEVNFFQS